VGVTGSSAIVGTGSNHEVILEGTVAADLGIQLGNSTSDHQNILSISETGKIFSASNWAVLVFGYSGEMENAGLIVSSGPGIYAGGSFSSGTFKLENSGTIRAGTVGIQTTGTQNFVLLNTGTIEVSNNALNAFQALGTNDNTVQNEGSIVGNVYFGDSRDIYVGYGGTITGYVYGRGGNDTLAGGDGKESLDGGAGDDEHIGGLGNDKLYGGADADTFIYAMVKDSKNTETERDTIDDFSQADVDVIDLSAIDANWTKADNQKFKFIGADGFNDKPGELRFKHKDGSTFVYGDTNGDGKIELAIELKGTIELVKDDFVF
jgi:Ca2+-binding RTX toxin-like protein